MCRKYDDGAIRNYELFYGYGTLLWIISAKNELVGSFQVSYEMKIDMIIRVSVVTTNACCVRVYQSTSPYPPLYTPSFQDKRPHTKITYLMLIFYYLFE